MKKDELRELAVWGMKRKVQAIEAQLAAYYHEFPEVFAGDTAPVLLKAEERENGKDWAMPGKPARKGWSPERRARMAAKISATNSKRLGKSTTNGHKASVGQRWYDRLKEHGPEHVTVSQKHIKTKNLTGAAYRWIKLGWIKRTAPSTYTTGTLPPTIAE